MKKMLAAAMAIGLLTSACASTNIKTTTQDFAAPSVETSTILLKPDVQMFSILASGILEARADWSIAAQENMQTALESALNDRASNVYFMDPDAELTEDQIQVLKLKDAVLLASKNYYLLKNKKDVFDLTLGPDAAVLANGTDAEFALVVSAQGSFQSAGKIAVNIAMAMIGGTIQTGIQLATLSLVDLETGHVVWTNTATLGAGASDPRTLPGAEKVVNTLLKDFPLE